MPNTAKNLNATTLRLGGDALGSMPISLPRLPQNSNAYPRPVGQFRKPELTPKEVDARRRLLFGYVHLFAAAEHQNLFPGFIEDVLTLVDVPWDMRVEAEAALQTYLGPTYRSHQDASRCHEKVPKKKADAVKAPGMKRRPGRPKGGTNKAGHKAGGDRRSSDFKDAQAAKNRQKLDGEDDDSIQSFQDLLDEADADQVSQEDEE